MKLTAIDAFCGAGGLSVGLARAGFTVVSAVDSDNQACNTYRANHPNVPCINQDISTVFKSTLLQGTSEQSVDLLAGCPPCQGFTSLSRKRQNELDSRDELVLQMARLAQEIRPRAVMMENVPGLMRKGKNLFKVLCNDLQSLGYKLTSKILQVADYGVPQLRKRLVLLGGLGFSIGLPVATHSGDPSDTLPRHRTVRDTIETMASPMSLAEAKHQNIKASDWHIVPTLSKQNRARIRSVKGGESRLRIPNHLRPYCHQKPTTGYSNAYGRMHWDQPSPTITGNCTTLSSGRFGHPVEDRTISVREAALLQTFPSDYQIVTRHMTHACTLIGNALPCDFAEAISRECAKELHAQM